MYALTRIDLRKNGLRRLPESLGKLHRLEDLTSMDNELESLPAELRYCESLEYLDISGTLISHLPA